MEIRTVYSSDVERCPKHSLAATHYRDDGSCRCDERTEAEVLVAQLWADLQEARERLRRC